MSLWSGLNFVVERLPSRKRIKTCYFDGKPKSCSEGANQTFALLADAFPAIASWAGVSVCMFHIHTESKSCIHAYIQTYIRLLFLRKH